MLKWMKGNNEYTGHEQVYDLPIKLMQSHSKWAATDILYSVLRYQEFTHKTMSYTAVGTT